MALDHVAAVTTTATATIIIIVAGRRRRKVISDFESRLGGGNGTVVGADTGNNGETERKRGGENEK
jgi:hypothetical protein